MRVLALTLLLLPHLASACGTAIAAHNKAWHDGLDFEATERVLKTAKIVRSIPIDQHLRKFGKRYRGSADVFYVELEGGLAGVAKPETEIWSSLAEEAGYQISRAAKLKLMAPTVIRQFPEFGNRSGSIQLYVHSPFHLKRPDQRAAAETLVSEKDRSDLILLQFILGRFDIHPENLIIDSTGAPVLFDVEEIHFLQHVQYGDFPFIRRMKHLRGIRSRPLPSDTFPFENQQRLFPANLGALWMTFKGHVYHSSIRESWRLYEEGYFGDAGIRYVIWDDSIWTYRPRKNAPALYTDVYSRETIENFRTLDFERLREKISPEFSPRHIQGFASRRDQVVEASTRGRWIP